MRIATFNIRIDVDAGERSFPNRLPLIERALLAMDADIVGFQEVAPAMRSALRVCLPDHRDFGKPREQGGEANPLFVRKNHTVEAATTRHYGTIPCGKDGFIQADAAFPRIHTRIEVHDGTRRFVVLNTHLDHESPRAREDALGKLVRFVEGLPKGTPVILMGDFNAPPAELASLLASGFRSCWERAADKNLTTFHGFSAKGEGEPIDHILVKGPLAVDSVHILRAEGPPFPSDHHPVFCDIRFLA